MKIPITIGKGTDTAKPRSKAPQGGAIILMIWYTDMYASLRLIESNDGMDCYITEEAQFWVFYTISISLLSMTFSLCNKGIVNELIFSCDHAALRTPLSVCPSICLSHLFHYVPVIVSSWNFQELLPLTKVMSMHEVKVRGQRSRSHGTKNRWFWPKLGVSGL